MLRVNGDFFVHTNILVRILIPLSVVFFLFSCFEQFRFGLCPCRSFMKVNMNSNSTQYSIYQMNNRGKTYEKKNKQKKSNTSRGEVNAFIQLTRIFKPKIFGCVSQRPFTLCLLICVYLFIIIKGCSTFDCQIFGQCFFYCSLLHLIYTRSAKRKCAVKNIKKGSHAYTHHLVDKMENWRTTTAKNALFIASLTKTTLCITF